MNLQWNDPARFLEAAALSSDAYAGSFETRDPQVRIAQIAIDAIEARVHCGGACIRTVEAFVHRVEALVRFEAQAVDLRIDFRIEALQARFRKRVRRDDRLQQFARGRLWRDPGATP